MLRKSLFILGLLTVAGTAWAQGTAIAFGSDDQNTNAPIEVVADALSLDEAAGTALYTGDVVVTQDQMRLSAPRVMVFFTEDNSDVARVEATGGALLVNGDEAAEADRADYEVATDVIVMTGNVLVAREDSTLTGERMVANIETGTAELEGRVRTLLRRSTDN